MDGNLLTFLQHNSNLKYTLFLKKLRKEIYTPISKFKAGIIKSKEPIPFSSISQMTFSPIQENEKWGNLFDCAWFEFNCDTDFDNLISKVLLIDVGGEGCIYTQNGAVQGITNVLGMVDNFQTAKGKQVVPLSRIFKEHQKHLHFYADCGYNGRIGNKPGDAVFRHALICDFRQDIFDLYYDVLASYQLLCAIDNKENKKEVKKIINKAIDVYKDNSCESVKRTRNILSPLFDGKYKEDFTVYAVGHGHLDLAWLWPVRETKRKSIRTFSNAVYQAERCPEYVFNASQPQQYEWLKENEPKLFERIKSAEKEGNIEAQGGMWVEPDTNLPCGESLIRQCYYGKNFFKKEFSKDVKTLWLPDVFGYSAALPQIIKKCSMENFMTIKLSWNNINSFPHHTFKWQGLDDSEVLVHMPPEGDYNSNATPYALTKTQKQYKEKDVSSIALMSYGIGDGGAGPGEYHIEMIKRCEKLRYIPKAKISSSDTFFEELQKNKEKYPSYKGELYLEKHQGTYTTQALVKKNNRTSEALLHFAEWISSAAFLKGKPYPKEKLDLIWKEVLLYQFHDILPGSSIHRVYEECNIRYEVIKSELREIIDSCIEFLSSDKKQLTAINQIDFNRKGYIKYNDSWYSYDIKPYCAAALVSANDVSDNLKYSNNSIENQKLKVIFNKNGQITEIIDKDNNYNCVASCFNAARIYKDRFVHPYNAWDIDINYTKQKPADMTLTQSKVYLDTKQVVWENSYTYSKSKLSQKIILKDDSAFIEVQNHVSWHETHKMLRIDFYPNNFGDKVLCDIQFGNIKRSTKTVSSVDYAQFEIPAHKWVDVYDGGYGVAIINNCKYGHRVKDGIISLNCLRSTVYPDETADRGEHDFTYVIYPHKQEPMESELTKIGYEINNPLKICENICDIASVASCDKSNVILETILVNENQNIVLRLYENKGAETVTNLKISVPHKTLYETDMLYQNAVEITDCALKFKPFEIKTFEIVL